MIHYFAKHLHEVYYAQMSAKQSRVANGELGIRTDPDVAHLEMSTIEGDLMLVWLPSDVDMEKSEFCWIRIDKVMEVLANDGVKAFVEDQRIGD